MHASKSLMFHAGRLAVKKMEASRYHSPLFPPAAQLIEDSLSHKKSPACQQLPMLLPVIRGVWRARLFGTESRMPLAFLIRSRHVTFHRKETTVLRTAALIRSPWSRFVQPVNLQG